MSSTLVTAFSGLIGVILGGLVQLFLARANTSRDQRRTYDQRRFEKRSNLYLRVLTYVDRLERKSGRSLSSYRFGKKKAGGAKKVEEEELQALAVELKVYGSWVTELQFSSWKVLYYEHLKACALRDAFSAAAEMDHAHGNLLPRSQNLIEVTSRQAGNMASDLANQVKKELLGIEFDGVGYRFRRWKRQRAIDAQKATIRQYIDGEFDELDKLFTEFADGVLR